VFPVKYELNSYILFRRNLVFKRVKAILKKHESICNWVVNDAVINCNGYLTSNDHKGHSDSPNLRGLRISTMGRCTMTVMVFA
jgi:hypothetical protein